jgi:hypothetical protein
MELQELERLAGTVVFTFYTELHPSLRITGSTITPDIPDSLITPAQRGALNKKAIIFLSGSTATDDPLVALMLLYAPKWMGVKPGSWYVGETQTVKPPVVETVEAPRAQIAKKRMRKK